MASIDVTTIRQGSPLPRKATSVEVPRQWRDDPAVMDGIYHTIDIRLLRAVADHLGSNRFEAGALRRELELGRAADAGHNVAGFNQGQPIAYQFLMPPEPLEFAADLLSQAAQEWGLSDGALRGAIDVGQQRLDALHNPIRGYVGWLLTSPTFLEEHDALLRQYQSRINQEGIPQPVWGIAHGEDLRGDSDDEWVSAFRELCERWRLQTLAAPSLPVPLEPQVPAIRPATRTPPGTVTIFFPDTSPTLGRGVVDESLEDLLHASVPEHLAAWIEIVSKHTTAKTQIAVYERRGRLQHFWRLLHQRFPDALQRTKKALTGVFAQFLGVSDDTIKGDLRAITSELGDRWADRPLTPR